VTRYDRATFNTDNSNDVFKLIANVVYLSHHFEQDAYLNGAYSYIMERFKEKENYIIAYKETEAYKSLETLKNSLEYLEKVSTDTIIDNHCKNEYSNSFKQILNYGKKAYARYSRKLARMCGQALLDINKERKKNVFFHVPFKNPMGLDKILSDLDKKQINTLLSSYKFRFKRTVNGVESEYYIRKFKKIPNLRNKKEELTDNVAQDNQTFEEYIDKNARIDNIMTPFTRETYPLAFAQTIYGDNCTQFVFTDNIDISHIVDHRGRPLTDIYATIIKRHEENEYSKCFGKVTSGIKIKHEKNTDDETKTKYAELNSIYLLNNLGCFSAKSLGGTDEDITINQDEFYGDIVEFNPYDAMEYVLEDIYFRFNTKQREESETRELRFDELESDDLDYNDFNVTEYKGNTINKNEEGELPVYGGKELKTTQRPEGYFYKPHYKIAFRQFGPVQQDTHTSLNVIHAEVRVIHDNTKKRKKGVLGIRLRTSLPHKCSAGDTIMFTDTCSNIKRFTKVVEVFSKTEFFIEPLEGINWVRLCTWINSEDRKTLYIYKLNNNITNYANQTEGKLYVWRNVLRPGDTEANVIKEYPFANGCFYVNSEINFFLQRQDPFNEYGLYAGKTYPNDVFGNTKKTSNEEYKTTEEEPC
jgi:hypothetical protein